MNVTNATMPYIDMYIFDNNNNGRVKRNETYLKQQDINITESWISP